MRRYLAILPIAAVAVAAAAGLAAAGDGDGTGNGNGSTAHGGRPVEADPAALYRADCATCHGDDATGTQYGPSLEGVGAASIDFELSTGRMPLIQAGRTETPRRPVAPLPGDRPFVGQRRTERHAPAYDTDTIAALTAYVADLAGGGPAIPEIRAGGDTANGGVLYRRQCAACHAWSGDGGALYHREAPPVHPATPVQVAEAVRVGPGQMPAFGAAAVDDRALDDLVAYVHELDDPHDRGGHPLSHVGPVAEGAVALVAVLALACTLRWIGERG